MGDLSPAKALTPAQRGAAALEAAGSNTEEIARALNVSKTTIKSWRKDPLYAVALDEIGRQATDDLLPVVTTVRNELAQSVLVAIKTLVENLEATDEDGRPHYSSRQAAAATLLSHADLVLEKPGNRGGGESGATQAAAQAVVKVTISDEAAGEGSPFHVEGEVVGEETVADAEVA